MSDGTGPTYVAGENRRYGMYADRRTGKVVFDSPGAFADFTDDAARVFAAVLLEADDANLRRDLARALISAATDLER